MLTTLSSLKTRLAIPEADTSRDALLTSAIKAVSSRFDKETNRTLARTENATYEFDPADTEICPPLYPIEAVTKWGTKSSETEGWLEQPTPDFLIRSACIISLPSPFGSQLSAINSQLARVTYTGGYVLPGTTPAPGQTPLPDDLEQAAVEQVAFWYQKRDQLGIRISWPSGGTYQQFSAQDLLPSVQSVLAAHRRWSL